MSDPLASWALIIGALSVAVAIVQSGPRLPWSVWRWLVGAVFVGAAAHAIGTMSESANGASAAAWWSGYGLALLELGASSIMAALAWRAGVDGNVNRLGAALVGLAAVRIVVATDDGLAVFAGLWLVVMGELVMGAADIRDRTGTRRSMQWTRLVTWLLVIGLGLVFVYGATAATGVDGLRGRAVAVFNRWGAAQPYVDALADPQLAPSYARHYRTEVVEGMAPAALLLPGLLLLVAGTGAGVLAWTHAPSSAYSRYWRGGVVRLVAAIALVRLVAVELATPLFSLRPYGVADAVMALGVVGSAAACLTAWRARRLAGLSAALSTAAAGAGLVWLGTSLRLAAFARGADGPASTGAIWLAMVTVVTWWGATAIEFAATSDRTRSTLATALARGRVRLLVCAAGPAIVSSIAAVWVLAIVGSLAAIPPIGGLLVVQWATVVAIGWRARKTR